MDDADELAAIEAVAFYPARRCSRRSGLLAALRSAPAGLLFCLCFGDGAAGTALNRTHTHTFLRALEGLQGVGGTRRPERNESGYEIFVERPASYCLQK